MEKLKRQTNNPEDLISSISLLREACNNLRPMYVSLELTYRCNLDCIHCYCIRGGTKKELTIEEWKQLLKHTADEGGLFLVLSGGEILVHKGFMEIYDYARDLGFAVRLKTNGTLITPEIADRIADRHPTHVDISVLGGEPVVHDRITRVRNSLDKAWRGIKLLRERGVKVKVSTPLMKDSLTGYMQIQTKAQGMGCSSSCDPTIFSKNDGDKTVMDNGIDEKQYKSLLTTMTMLMPVTGDKKDASNPNLLMCNAGRGHFSINPYGDITTCNPMQLPLGNVRTDTWAQVRSSQLLKRIVNLKLKDLPECRECEYRIYCDRCHANTLQETGSITQKSIAACKKAKVAKALADAHAPNTWKPKEKVTR